MAGPLIRWVREHYVNIIGLHTKHCPALNSLIGSCNCGLVEAVEAEKEWADA